jgi:hypothetical protein
MKGLKLKTSDWGVSFTIICLLFIDGWIRHENLHEAVTRVLLFGILFLLPITIATCRTALRLEAKLDALENKTPTTKSS